MKNDENLKEKIIESGERWTEQREVIGRIFFNTDGHISIEELYSKVKREKPSIGYATLYRTMNLFEKKGLAIKRNFGKGNIVYERVNSESHHDHLICIQCGKILEFQNSAIEIIQEQVAKKNNFKIVYHKLEIYGLCSDCR